MRKGRQIKTRKIPVKKPPGVQGNSPENDPLRHTRLLRYMEDHFEWMLITGYSEDTVRARRQALRRFITWCDERGLDEPQEITRPMLERYQKSLFYYRKANGAPLSTGMQLQYLAPLKTWFKWLSKSRHILANPAADLDLPKLHKRLPRDVPSIAEVEAILAEADPQTPAGLRDRALLETLYATGLRRMELPTTTIYDVDLNRGVLWVRHGKGKRERVVPLGDRAVAWLEKYLVESRPQLLTGDTETLFLTDYGEAMQPHYVADKVKRYMRFAGCTKSGSTHLLRHACATHMLEGGADIRYIQEMLGHANLQTTEIYTHVSIDKLIAVHGATHPSRLTRHRDPENKVSSPNLDEVKETLLTAIEGEDEAEMGSDEAGVATDVPEAARR